MFKKIIPISIFALFCFLLTNLFFPASVAALSNSPEALEVQVNQILEQKTVAFDDLGQMIEPTPECLADSQNCLTQNYQKFQALVLAPAEKKDQVVTIISGDNPNIALFDYQIGDKLIVEPDLTNNLSTSTDPTNQSELIYHVNDYLRRDSIIILFIIFLIIVFIVTRWKGLRAVVGMVYSFVIIFKITLPLIVAGHNPFLVAILTIVLILPPTFYFSHGFNRQSNAALIGTAISLLLTTFCAFLAIKGTHLTGYANEESSFILALMGGRINVQGLLIAGIMISALGTLNDVTVSQASIVAELKKENPQQNFGELYRKAMHVGRDHIVSMVDTLILVYAGGSLPLLILIADSSRPLLEIMNYELIAQELVNMLIGSIGVVLAVPITTAVAGLFFDD